jgi:Leucine-rich repeat
LEPQNQFDCIDLTDNAVVRLEGFPKLPRLKHLLLSNNRVMRIAKNLEGKALCPLHFELLTSWVMGGWNGARRAASVGSFLLPKPSPYKIMSGQNNVSA